jgi:putative addiction module killer protein
MDDLVSIEIYENDNGKSPYLDWELGLPQQVQGLIRTRLARVRLGNFGDCKPIVGEKGLFELRIHISPGFRIYFGKAGNKLILLLTGGEKGSQKRDIAKAKEYWNSYQTGRELWQRRKVTRNTLTKN